MDLNIWQFVIILLVTWFAGYAVGRRDGFDRGIDAAWEIVRGKGSKP